MPEPARSCVDRLDPRVPAIVLFRDEDRRLETEYDLNVVAADPPPALKHLAALAGLDLGALRDEAASGLIADVSTRRDAANRALRDAFAEAWNQKDVAVQLEVQGNLLHVQATTPQDKGVSSISDRSDGMRWFAALLAYARGRDDNPILLVDEIETHLHYDAQADLIQVISEQTFTSKVIYTTHSFGSLPQDLGLGVRVVEQIDTATSRLENSFWRSGAGFSPLLSAMGAAATSLTPTRHAVLGEGPSEAILLPTLLRQASGTKRLGFQVAPGLASVAATSVPGLDAEAGHVAFVVDGDAAGVAITNKLTRAGVSPARIVQLVDVDTSEPLMLEDLIDAGVLSDAWNAEVELWQTGSPRIPASEFVAPLCMTAAEAWATANGVSMPDKVAVAERVVDSTYDFEAGKPRQVFRASRTATLAWLLAELSRAVGTVH
jgi:putative AbiEii toxin of type IV toxin-antitoxin system